MRNTICATLTAITLTLCTALAGCGSAYTLKLQNMEALAGLLSDGWSVMRTDVLPGLGGKGEYEVEPNICYEPSFPPTIVYILEKEAE